MRTAPVTAASLIAGYGAATATGSRPLGGIVFAAGTAWCCREWVDRRGAPAAIFLVGCQFGAIMASHRLARRVGAWPSVLISSGVSGAAAALVADRR